MSLDKSMQKTSSDRNLLYSLLMFAPVLICVLIMLPRLSSAQFGLLDDGTTILTSQKIAAGTWSLGNEAGAGRFRPAYWLYYGLIYLAAGPDPRAFFAGNLAMFVLITAGLIFLVRINGGSRLAAGLAGLFFVLAGTAIENFYTLSKPEAPQVLGLTLLLIALSLYARSTSRIARLLLIALLILSMALVMAVKETGLAMIPISLAWLGIAWLVERDRVKRPDTGSRLVLVLVVFSIGLGFILLRARYVTLGLPGGGYSSNYAFTPQRFLSSGFHWAAWLVRDYPYLLPIGLFVLIAGIKRDLAPFGRRYLEWLVWMAVWVVVYLPWVYSLEYYLLPFAFGCAAFCGLAVDQGIQRLARSSSSGRVALGVYLGSVLALLVITIPNNVTNGRLQLAVDAANAQMLQDLAQSLPQNARLLVNLPPGNEYYHEIEMHLATLYHRPDITLQRFPFDSQASEAQTPLPYTILSPQVSNPPRLSVRLGVDAAISAQGNKRLKQFFGKDPAPQMTVERRYRNFTVDFLRIACPFFRNRGYCAASSGLLDRSWMTYRWNIFTVTQHPQSTSAQ